MKQIIMKLLTVLLSMTVTFGQSQEAITAQIPNTLTNEEKVYGLSRFWQEVNYNFVFLNRIDRAKWDSTYRAMIKTVQQTENDYEYYRVLQRFSALLKDAHTNVSFPESINSLIYRTNFGTYRIFLKNIDGKVIITNTNKSKRNELPIGSEIIEVNGLPTQEYIDKFVAPYISSSTDHALREWAGWKLLEGMEGDQYEIKIKTPDGKIKSLSLTIEKTEEKEVYPPFEFKDQLLEFKWFDKIAYVSLNSFHDPNIVTLFVEKLPELYKAKGLIIDLRFNGGGSTYIGRSILEYLTTDSILYHPKFITRKHIPAYKAYGQFVQPEDTISNDLAKKYFLFSQDKYYYTFDDYDHYLYIVNSTQKKVVVPTVVLIGTNTASAAECFLVYADNQEHFIKIGEKTFGSTGQPFSFNLPGGGSARVKTIKSTFPDNREFVGYGIKPDIEVKPTVDDFLKNKDAALNKALDYLKTKMKNNRQ